MKKLLIILLCIISGQLLQATTNCRIDFAIKGLENKNIILACEYGNKQIIIDTVQLDKEAKGFYTSNKKRLVTGIYIVLFPNQKYIELLINNEQFFTVISDTSGLFSNLIIEGSDETELYREYLVLTTE